MNEICLKTIQNQERFVQLGTGWLLRNVGEANKKQLFDFIEGNIQHFTREGLSYAVEKLKPKERSKWMDFRKQSTVSQLQEEIEVEIKEAVQKKKKTKK